MRPITDVLREYRRGRAVDLAAMLTMKREGWKARKIAGEWLHGCARCGVPA